VGAAKLGFLFNDGEVTTVGFRLTVGQVAQLAVNILSLALFIASLVMVLGTFARSQREAGVYTAPLVFITIFLAIFSFSSSDFGLGLYAVPILGNALAMRETFLQSLGADQILLAIAGNVVLFLVMVQISAWMYRREDVMFRP
jgi:ABC-type Na+ efflux pump permease subunit